MNAYKINGSEIIGIDHGFGNMKTRNTVFRTGVKSFKDIPTFGIDVLNYEGMYYLIGEGHKPFMAEKIADQDYYILTLAAIAKELKIRGMKSADVILAVGLPIVWVSNQREEFKKYLMQKENVEFLYKDICYRIHIKDVRIYPQGFAAVASNLTGFDGINILADIGNGTMNTLFINDHKPQGDKFYTDKLGVQQCINQIKNRLLSESGSVINESQIEKFLITGKLDIKPEYQQSMREEAEEYVKGIFSKLIEYDYNPDLMKLHVVGGGGCLIKNFGIYDHSRVEIITDICATAKGYEIVAYNSMEREKRLGA